MRMSTIIAGGLLAGALACPAPARAEQCKASIMPQKGEPAAAVLDKKGFTIETPLLEGVLRTEMPKSYVDKLLARASGVAEAERHAFVRGAIMRNVEAALSSIGRKKTARFECAQLGAQPAPAPVGAKKPEPAQPPVVASKPASVAPKPEPAASKTGEDKTAQPEEAQEPAKPAEPEKPQTERKRRTLSL